MPPATIRRGLWVTMVVNERRFSGARHSRHSMGLDSDNPWHTGARARRHATQTKLSSPRSMHRAAEEM
ncbi:MAG TPA: hypothetical protein VK116_01690, partial [Planctomycetota bacterium]|nr:hypothetical protein [Planctomycetota bacterium]